MHLLIPCDLLKVSDEPCLQQTLCLLLQLLEFFIQALDAQLISQVKKTTKNYEQCASWKAYSLWFNDIPKLPHGLVFIPASFPQAIAHLLLFSVPLHKINILRFNDYTEQHSSVILFAGLCFLQVFSLLSSLLRMDPPDHVRQAMLDFLSSVGKVFIPPEVQVIITVVLL